jgi:hypothetical protein
VTRRQVFAVGFLCALGPAGAAHDILNPFAATVNPVPVGGTGVAGSAWGELIEDPNGLITVSSVTQTPADPTCTSPLNVQFSLARGFAGANGFVIANGYVEDMDDDGMVSGDPTGCADLAGQIGCVACSPSSSCTGLDPTIAVGFQTAYGLSSQLPTSNRAVFQVSFSASQPATIDVAYTFATFENPTDPSFYDSFAILIDGTFKAGGISRSASVGPFGGPLPGTDPWTLSPSPGLPSPEFNRPPFPAFFTFPAHTTGLRVISVPVSAGAHTVEFHVADGGLSSGGCFTGTDPGGDPFVTSALFFGLSTYDSGMSAAAGTCGTATVTRVGHPAETTGPHGPTGTGFQDFQVREAGAVAGSDSFVVLGSQAASLPIAGSCNLFVNPAGSLFLVFYAGVIPPSGVLDWPPAGPVLPPGSAGSKVYVQFWNVLPGGVLENTKGMRVSIGPS